MLLSSSMDAAKLFAPMLGERPCERVVIAYLGRERELLEVEQSEGGTDEAELPLRRIIAQALALDAAGLIVAHNHPSGDPCPSAADIDATRRLADTAGALGLRLYDHLIFARGGFRSMRALGLL